MQREEWIATILTEVTINPKISNNDLAEKYGVHRNRISRYRNLLRKRLIRTNTETVNKIDSILEDHLVTMEDRDLIAYRKQLVPQQSEVKEVSLSKAEIKHVVEFADPNSTTPDQI